MGYTVWPDRATGEVVREIYEERQKQNTKWGEQNHTPQYWLCILAEEFGEAAKEVTKLYEDTGVEPIDRVKLLREELIQTAAVCAGFIESLDRNILKVKQ